MINFEQWEGFEGRIWKEEDNKTTNKETYQQTGYVTFLY